MKQEITLYSNSQLPELISLLEQAVAAGEHTIIITPKQKGRTSLQNRSLHKYFSITADKMNIAGITQRKLVSGLKEGFELDVTPEMVKNIFRKVGEQMYGKDSTSKLTTKEIQEVYLVTDRGFSEVFGLTTEWPSDEPAALKGV